MAADRLPHHRDRVPALGLGQPRPQASLDHGCAGVWEEVGESWLRCLGAQARLEHEPQHEVGAVERRRAAQPVADRQLERALCVLRVDHLPGCVGEPLLVGGRQPARRRHPARRPRGAISLRLLLRAVEVDPVEDLAGCLVDEGARPVDDLDRPLAGELAADARRRLRRSAAGSPRCSPRGSACGRRPASAACRSAGRARGSRSARRRTSGADRRWPEPQHRRCRRRSTGTRSVSRRSASSAPRTESTTTAATTSRARRTENDVSRPSSLPTSRLDQRLIRLAMRV